jgi:DNA recombination-dependent growth factor C
LVLSQIKYEALTEQADDLDGLEPEIAALAELDAQFALLSQELAQLYPKLISVFK